jgi:transcriptional regulator with XRE-family HTH domain
MNSAKLARLMGIDSGMVSRHELGKNMPNDRTIRLYAHHLDVSPAWLSYGKDKDAPRDINMSPEPRPRLAKALRNEQQTNDEMLLRISDISARLGPLSPAEIAGVKKLYQSDSPPSLERLEREVLHLRLEASPTKENQAAFNEAIDRHIAEQQGRKIDLVSKDEVPSSSPAIARRPKPQND